MMTRSFTSFAIICATLLLNASATAAKQISNSPPIIAAANNKLELVPSLQDQSPSPAAPAAPQSNTRGNAPNLNINQAGKHPLLPDSADIKSPKQNNQDKNPPVPDGGGIAGDNNVGQGPIPPIDVLCSITPLVPPQLEEQASSTTLSIADALDEALVRSPRAAAIRAQLGMAIAGYAAATVMPNPVLYRDEGAIAEQVRRFGVNRTLDPPWKIAFRLLAAKQQVKETKLELLNSLWTFRNDVRRAYTEMVMAQESYVTLQEIYALAMRLHNVSEKLMKAGSVAGLDVLKARLATSQTAIDTLQSASRVELARRQMNIILGRSAAIPVQAPRLVPVFQLRAERTGLLPDLHKPVPAIDEFLEKAFRNRLELKIIDQQVKLAQAQLYNAVGNIIPDPSFSTGQSVEGNPPAGPKLTGFFVTMNVELPVFGVSQGDIARLKAQIKQLHAQRLAQRNQVIADVNTAYNHLVTARRKIQLYQERVLAESLEVARLARRSYEVGQSDITSTLAAQQANFQTRSQYLDAVATYQQAFIDLEQSVGEPLR